MKLVLAKERGPFRSRIFGLDDGKRTPLFTPLFVPSVSSVASEHWRELLSSIAQGAAGRSLVLVSAFDIANEDKLPEVINGFRGVILDSGGYEARRLRSRWSSKRFESIASQFHAEIVVGFDSVNAGDHNIKLQISRQVKFLKTLPREVLRTILLHVDLGQIELVPLVELLIKYANDFDIIGLTEKDLGLSFPRRIQGVANLRIEMDRLGLFRPLHIFGVDDPLSLILYSAAGADIFDGLGWATEFIDTSSMSRHDLGHGPLCERWSEFVKKHSTANSLDNKTSLRLTFEWNIVAFEDLLAEIRRAISRDDSSVFYELCSRSHRNTENIFQELKNGR